MDFIIERESEARAVAFRCHVGGGDRGALPAKVSMQSVKIWSAV